MKIELSSYNNEKDEEANNKLIIDDNEKIIQSDSLNKYSLIKSPEEQFKNYPNYRFFKKYGILFCKIGNTLTCKFDSKNNNSPKICIGPHWYLAIVANILITTLLTVMYKALIDTIIPFTNKLIYFCLSIFVYFFFNRCALINPGIVQRKFRDEKNTEYCSICEVYYEPNKKVEHCKMCNICVEKMDHHCVWVGKCVGKNNVCSFYSMLVSIGIVYAYIIYLGFFQYSHRISRITK